jgi:hypothetical protein
MRARRIIRVQPPAPLGEVTVAPAALTGRPEADMARAMAAALGDVDAPSAAHTSDRWRQAFPPAPSGAGMTALGMMMERVRRFG